MYDFAIVILDGTKYLLHYNTNALAPSELKKIMEEHDMEDDLDAFMEMLEIDFDSELTEFEDISVYNLD